MTRCSRAPSSAPRLRRRGWSQMPEPSRFESERVLVLMPTVRDSQRTSLLLEEAHVLGAICGELNDLCRELRSGAGAVLLTDEAISRDTAGQLAEALRDQPAWSAVPVVVLAREGWSRSGGAAASEPFENLIVVERPVRARTLL